MILDELDECLEFGTRVLFKICDGIEYRPVLGRGSFLPTTGPIIVVRSVTLGLLSRTRNQSSVGCQEALSIYM